MIRLRDIAALLAALVLTRMAWNDSTESIEASAHLAFYLPREKATTVSSMDVDGDGTNEALVVIQRSSDNWEWKVLDLKALSPRKGSMTNTALPPFQPPVLFSYKDDHRDAKVSPLQISTGQVIVKPPGSVISRQKMDLSKVDSTIEINDRNRHYFCGSDWHDASQKCTHPCPSGQTSECPDDNKCYADTPCDMKNEASKEDTQVLFELTPGGGLPSVVSLWSDGQLSMTSLTNRHHEASSEQASKGASNSLGLNFMWKVDLLADISHPQNIFWVEHNVLFLDAYDSSVTAGAEHGMILVSGIYIDEGNSQGDSSEDDRDIANQTMVSFLIAIDAMNGKKLWDSTLFNGEKKKDEEPLPLPITRGQSSYARRRSKIPSLSAEQSNRGDLRNLPDCQVTFRQHLKHALPYAYWTSKDSHLAALHLDQSKKDTHHYKKSDKSHPVIGKDAPRVTTKHKQKWHHKFHRRKHPTPVKGRPNVLVTHTRGGMQIRSLRNGYPICHISLLEETLYADLNNDGTLDQVQVLLPNKKLDASDKWVRTLLSKVQKDKKVNASYKKENSEASILAQGNQLCHALAISGLPAREELFSSSLCGSAHERVALHPSIGLDSATPLVVESLSGRRNTRDVIVALSNGMVHRLQGRSGRKEWSIVGNHHENFPLWEGSGTYNVAMARLQSTTIPPPIRPILLVGENSVAVLSAKNGNVLASAPFPQMTTSRPIFADTTGDGTTDVIVTSLDGIWGVQIQVQPGRPVVLRMLVGALLFLIMLAILRNRFGGVSKKDIRATDL